MPAWRLATAASVILIGVAIGNVPTVGLIVEPFRHLHRVHLGAYLEGGLHGEVAIASQYASEGAMHDVAANLVAVFGACDPIDPPQQRLQTRNVVGVDEEIDQQRGASERLVPM